jgi:phage-related minor tail protein
VKSKKQRGKMKDFKYETIAVEPQIKEEIREIAQKQGRKIYAVIADVWQFYKKNLQENIDISTK